MYLNLQNQAKDSRHLPTTQEQAASIGNQFDLRELSFIVQMKFQYLLEIVFIRLSLKATTSQTLRIALVEIQPDQSTLVCNGCQQQLQLRRLQRKLDLSDLDAFKTTLESEQKAIHAISITDEGSAGKVLEMILVDSAGILKQFEEKGRNSLQQNYQGKYLSLQFKVNCSKKEVQKIELNIIDPNGEKEIRQSSRARRPPQLMIKKKSDLIASSKSLENKEQARQDLFKGIQQTPDKKPTKTQKEREKDHYNWEIMSALPQTLSAWIKKKSHKPQQKSHDDSEFQQVKELLQSHHPVQSGHDHLSKLSIKLKIVIVLLVVGFFFLIVDMFKEKKVRKSSSHGNHPKPARHDHQQGSHATKKKKKKVRKDKKETHV